jgi:hypothetical protein
MKRPIDLPCRLEAVLPPWKPTESYLSLLTTESHSTLLTTYIRLLLITPTLKRIIQFQNRLHQKVGTRIPDARRHKLIKIAMPTQSRPDRGSGSYTPKQLEKMKRPDIERPPPMKEQDTNFQEMRRYRFASICLPILKIMLGLYASYNATFQRMDIGEYMVLSILELLVALYASYRREGPIFYATICLATLQLLGILHVLYKAQVFSSILRAL